MTKRILALIGAIAVLAFFIYGIYSMVSN